MSQGELPVSLEARLTLVQFFGEVQVEAMRRFGVTPGHLINPRFKAQHLMPAREWAVRELHRCVYRVGMGEKALLHIDIPDWLSQQHTWEETPLPDECEPIGFLTLATLLGLDHSTLVL